MAARRRRGRRGAPPRGVAGCGGRRRRTGTIWWTGKIGCRGGACARCAGMPACVRGDPTRADGCKGRRGAAPGAGFAPRVRRPGGRGRGSPGEARNLLAILPVGLGARHSAILRLPSPSPRARILPPCTPSLQRGLTSERKTTHGPASGRNGPRGPAEGWGGGRGGDAATVPGVWRHGAGRGGARLASRPRRRTTGRRSARVARRRSLQKSLLPKSLS
ncbi:hypothetical protein T484DRAFT_1907115 [Baffinella frigidus]|nr:hypothetical protein T484DRAFT_1907115 [Cryptophyta sp. CCMP2293]